MINKLKNFKKIILITIFFTFVGGSIFATSHETSSNNAPIITGEETITITVDENQRDVTNVESTDVDANQEDTFLTTLTGEDNSQFTITTDGVLTFIDAPDFENPTDDNTNNEYIVIVTADDGNGGTDTQTITVIVADVSIILTPVSAITDGVGGFTELDGANGITTTKIETKTYALVASVDDDGVQIIDITDPTTPTVVSAITDGVGEFTELDGARGITTTKIGTKTYALVASSNDDGVQIIDITNPALPTSVSAITDGVGGFTELDGAYDITTTIIGTKTYALVASSDDDGVQIIDITNPASPTPVSAITDGVGGFTQLNIANSITITKIETKTYALVTAYNGGIQIIDITNPALPISVSTLIPNSDNYAFYTLEDITTTKIGTETYALIVSYYDGLRIMDITDPTTPTTVSHILSTDKVFTSLGAPWKITTTKIETKTYALFTSFNGDDVQIIDITNPALPTPVSVIDDGEVFTELDNARGITTTKIGTKTYALVASNADDGVQIIQLTPEIIPPTAPVISGEETITITVDENQNAVTTISASDDNDDTITYSLSGEDNSKFTITTDGVLTFIDAPDFENPTDDNANNEYIVIVTASDGTLTDTQTITVIVADVVFTIAPASAITDGVGGFNVLDNTWSITTTKIGPKTYALVTSNTDDGVQIIDITNPASPTPVSAITDGVGEFTELDGARKITTTKIGTKTYALVVSDTDDGVQIIDITNPALPTPVSAITDGVGEFTELDGALGITTTKIGTKTYALVASSNDDGVQIIDITNPITPTPVSAITDGVGGFTKLDGANDITTTKIETKTYALVTSFNDNGVQIIDITNPALPTSVSAITDGEVFTKLNGARGITTTKIETKTYALVTSFFDDGVQIIDITNPALPTSVSAITDGVGGFTKLDGAWDITTTTIGTKTYVLVASFNDDGVQIIDITNPASPTPVSAITDGVGEFTELDGARGITTTKIGTKTYVLVASFNDDGVQIIELTPETPPSTSLDVDGDGIISESDIRALFFRAQLASFAAFDYLGKTNSRSIELETQYQNILNSPLLDINGDDLTDESEIRTFFFRAQLASFAAFDYLGKTNSRSIELENQYNDILD